MRTNCVAEAETNYVKNLNENYGKQILLIFFNKQKTLRNRSFITMFYSLKLYFYCGFFFSFQVCVCKFVIRVQNGCITTCELIQNQCIINQNNVIHLAIAEQIGRPTLIFPVLKLDVLSMLRMQLKAAARWNRFHATQSIHDIIIDGVPGNVIELWFLSGSESRDYCLHESFNATCRPGTAILMTSAIYGRMRLGRCISGDFNIGCSKDVITYFDRHCTGQRTCDVTLRNLVDVHPCQRDFMSYLEASFKCVPGNALQSPLIIVKVIVILIVIE